MQVNQEVLAKLRNILKMKREMSKEMKRLLRLRLEMERNEPRWMRMDEWRFWRIERQDRWRRPKGLDNKIRHQIKGYPPLVKVGYRQPKAVRGLHPSGFEPVRVFRPEDLDKIDPSRQAIIIASTVSKRKRIEIIKKALEKGIKVLNLTYEDMKQLLGVTNVEEVKKLLGLPTGE
jgi:large subunit ribosomal protein L32e